MKVMCRNGLKGQQVLCLGLPFPKMLYAKLTIAVLLFSQFAVITTATAQAQIGSFCGIKLGMTLPEVRSALASQGKSMEQYKKDPNCYTVQKMQLGGHTFDRLFLRFKNSRLVLGGLNSSYQSDGVLSHPSHYTMESVASQYKSAFNSLRLKFVSKYGEPLSEDDNELIWRKGTKQLTLSYEFDDKCLEGVEGIMPTTRHMFSQLHVRYEDDSSTSDY